MGVPAATEEVEMKEDGECSKPEPEQAQNPVLAKSEEVEDEGAEAVAVAEVPEVVAEIAEAVAEEVAETVAQSIAVAEGVDEAGAESGLTASLCTR